MALWSHPVSAQAIDHVDEDMVARRTTLFPLITLVAVTMATQSARAQPPSPLPAADASRRVTAVRIPDGRIQIDGRFDEAEWQKAEAAEQFVQQQPTEGAAATEVHRSSVRFLYDNEFLYIGGTFAEDELDKLVVNELRRDFSARDGDLFVVILDTFLDKLNAYNFQTNPACALRDSQSYDDGRNINANWDAVWFCRASLGEREWYVEKAIPFKQLRFPESDEQVWGLQVFRLIRHANEHTIWNPTPRQFNQFKTSYAGLIQGISGVRPGRNIRFKPFATGGVIEGNRGRDTTWDGGFDTKIGIGTNLVLDGTFRTDFSQVEADTQQVNLTRFNLFFPERREFFLENQGAFQIGGFAQNNNNLVPFFSRTIGLSDTGTPIPIVGGARLTGRIGRSTVGVLNMQTERQERPDMEPLPAANFTVARYSRDFLSNSSAGVFFLDKERGDVSNRLVGGELRFNLFRNMNLDGLLIHSEKTGFDSGNAWRAGFQYDPGLTAYALSYTSLGTSFKNDLGFIPREGVDILTASVLRRLRPRATASFVREFRASLPFNRFTREGVGVETLTLAPSFTAEFPDASTVSFTVQRSEERLASSFRPQGMPAGSSIGAGTYEFTSGEIAYSGANARRVALTGGYRFGGYFGGERTGFTGGVRLRVNAHLATSVSMSRDVVNVAGASFNTNLMSVRIDSAFSTRMFLNAFVQYNSVSNQVLTNIRYNFIHRPLSDVFLVYTDGRSTLPGDAPTSRSLVLKVTRLFSL